MKREKQLVYISLGTVVKGAASFFQKCVDAFRDERDIDVIISVGNKFDNGKLKNVPSHVHLYSAVPQTEVLKMCDVFVTHGGMNSVSEALVCGVPMVVIPFASDQPVNARCVEKLGAGRKLESTEVTADKLREYVRSMLSDQHIKEHLKGIQKLIDQAPGNRGGAEMMIEHYRKYAKKG